MAFFKLWLNGITHKSWGKGFSVLGGCVVLGISAYGAYYYLKNKNRLIDEGFEDISMAEDIEKKILVLGLNGAGKSSFLAHLSKGGTNESKPEPTDGFSVVSVSTGNGKILNFWEIGGSENVRIYWSNFLEDTDVLVYIVDSADDHRLPESILELQKLAVCDKLKKIPIVILANKQDLPNALLPEAVSEAFGVTELARHNRVQVLPLQVPVDDRESHKSVGIAKDFIVTLSSGK